MFLKAIELQGFKSFPERTRLELKPGVTAVVGPNGSGKSNISDAVRWVLGEQSGKTLRLGRMEDVIFSGTKSRRAMGFARVSLIFDNQSRTLPYDLDEVSVTRQLFRTGESEYLRNNELCRLKDIAEMFMDTGLGRDGYSVIGQGRIAEIISSKATDRREIFEEATGITRFKHRKQDALKNLSMADENLIRLGDIILELETRIEPLRIASGKAKEFLALSEEKKKLEVSLFLERLNSFNDEIAAINEVLAVLEGERTGADNRTLLLEEEIEAAFVRMTRLSEGVEAVRAIIAADEEQIKALDMQAAVRSNDISHKRESIKSLESDIALLQDKHSDMDRQIEDQRVQAEELTRQYEERSREVETLTALLSELSAAGAGTSERLGQLYLDIERLGTERSRNRLELAVAENACEAANRRIREIEEALTQNEDKRSALNGELIELTGLKEDLLHRQTGQQNVKSGYERRLNERLGKLKETTDRLAAAKGEHGDTVRRIKLITELQNSLEGYAGSVKALIKAGQDGRLRGIFGAVSHLITTAPDYTTAIETALGGALQNLVCADEDSAKAGISYLSEQKLGRATFLPLTSVKPSSLVERGLDGCDGFVGIASSLVQCEPKFRGIADNLLGRVVVCDDIDNGIAMAKRFSYRFRIVTLDGQIINAGGSFTGGSKQAHGFMSRQLELSELKEKADRLNERVTELENSRIHTEASVTEIKEQVSAVERTIRQLEDELLKADATGAQLERALEDTVKAGERLRDELVTQNTLISGGKDETVRLNAAFQKLTEELSELEARRDSIREEEQSKRTQAEELSARLTELRMSALELQKDAQAAKVRLELLLTDKSGAEGRADTIKAQIGTLLSEITAAEGEISALETKKAAMLAGIASHKAGIDERLQGRMTIEGEITRLRGEEKTLSARREGLSAEIAREQEKLSARRTEYDRIIAELWDEYSLTRTEAMEIYEKPEDVRGATARLSTLKQKIKGLGAVNTDAIDEYREVSMRYEFLTAQRRDVERSKQELIRLIEEITLTMRTQFEDGFNRINALFSEIFKELFGGGEAHLRLTEPDDILESGIEILANPPGKLIKHLTALSGGEQAFIAIALYFAFLKVNPSPFCVLDEIEAALDDVNVVRFAQYLVTVSSATQFIVITHRRGTMEHSDTLYGVTMQEEGVSGLVSLSLTDREASEQTA